MKTKVDLKEDQFDAIQCSVGDDLELFTQQLNDQKVKNSEGIKFLFLNQMTNSNNDFLHYSCSRYTSLEHHNINTYLEHKVSKLYNFFFIFPWDKFLSVLLIMIFIKLIVSPLW